VKASTFDGLLIASGLSADSAGLTQIASHLDNGGTIEGSREAAVVEKIGDQGRANSYDREEWITLDEINRIHS